MRQQARLRERLSAAVSLKNILFEHLYHKPLLEFEALYRQLLELRERVAPYVGDVAGFVHQAVREGKTILLEGQLGSMKDPDLGIFPMTTSSHTLAGFGCVGASIPPTAMEEIICVTKAYSSCVGSQREPRTNPSSTTSTWPSAPAIFCWDGFAQTSAMFSPIVKKGKRPSGSSSA